MVGLKALVEFRQGLLDRLGDQTGEFEGEVLGRVCRLGWEKQNKSERDQGTIDIEVSRGGAVLLPLHPPESVSGLWAGRRWGLYLLDPLDSASTPSAPPRLVWVNAEVRQELDELKWEKRLHPCRVIDYTGDQGNVRGSIWVEAEGRRRRVLQMEVRLGDDRWTIRRGDE
jgi:hypothetical protein